ncbi:MAG: pyruvate, phosphate dikinase [Deltaproteobacteria bacterium]|jgi:pyruvate,orthophosphate dikinase|nr:pyruvate, phosphate dikinase [Deltaproteobacteria bacterium]
MASKMVYSFGGPKTDGNGGMRNLLGGKGANLAEMAKIGLPVPAGFTITTEVCTAFYESGKQFPPNLKKDVEAALAGVEKQMGAKFGSSENPLLVSCRSGARVSMPGMMDTVLNIGLNDKTLAGLIAKTGNPRFAYDSYRRFVAMYGDVVMGIKDAMKVSHDPFHQLLDKAKETKGYNLDTQMTVEDLKDLVAAYKKLYKDVFRKPFPEDPMEQLWGAIGAVFDSWMIPRAKDYRSLNHIPEDWGTAVNVQAMVFGNMGDDSATGVAFSRDPATGENYFYGEYLVNAQGEDVVAGIRTPNPINRARPLPAGVKVSLADEMPELYKELDDVRIALEKHYHDMQDIEFTIQQGKLYMLQCRNGKRTGHAAVKIAVDQVKEKLITKQEAILRFEPDHLVQVLLPFFDKNSDEFKKASPVASGLPASPGAAVGQAFFSAADAEAQAKNGKKVILVRQETSPEDIKGMAAAQGILTSRGGATSHAAVVARGMGRPCIVGAAIDVDHDKKCFSVGQLVVKEGDFISLDGAAGKVYKAALPAKNIELPPEFSTFMGWVDDEMKMKVRTNADTPFDAKVARDYGAAGIGLCRTEHMFFMSDRIDHFRKMILADNLEERKKALAAILPMQREDFYEIFKAMDGLPVTIRTLDPPLHEFLPHTEREIADLAKKFHLKAEDVKSRINALHEQNPMLGLRGCRLGILYPEITEMQARAIFEAARKAAAEGVTVLPEIMIPLIGTEKEFALQKKVVDDVAKEIFGSSGKKVDYLVGTMIELPRAALVADKVVGAGAQFFSFGTNDLTQTTFGLSRDDSGMFLPQYVDELRIWTKDPFVTIDTEGMGQLMEIGVARGRKMDRQLKVGICGEHGGDPDSVKFCYSQGFDYVSCSPHRVPVARLAAAQAALQMKAAKTSGKGADKAAAQKAPARTLRPASRGVGRPAAKAGKNDKWKKELAVKLVQDIAPMTKESVGALKRGTAKTKKAGRPKK